MNYKIQFTDQTDKETKIKANSDKTLIEVQEITEGNFLIFSDVPRLEDQILQLKEDNLILMDVLATMYEDMLAKGTV